MKPIINRRTLLAAAPLAAVPFLPAQAQVSLDAGTILVTAPYNVTSSDNGRLILVDASSGTAGLTFAAAASLVSGGSFMVGVKKIDNSSAQVPMQSGGGETFDLLYPSRRLIQTQDSTFVAAFVDQQGIGRLITFGGSFTVGAMRGHRTINAAACHNDAYNVSFEDYGILHRCVPPGTAGGQVALYLPHLTQVTGTNPDGSPSYLSKTFWFQLCSSHPAGTAIIATGGASINNRPRIDIMTPFAGLIVQCAGDQWWAQATQGAGAVV